MSNPTSFRLSEKAAERLEVCAEELDVSKTTIIELALYDYYRWVVKGDAGRRVERVPQGPKADPADDGSVAG